MEARRGAEGTSDHDRARLALTWWGATSATVLVADEDPSSREDVAGLLGPGVDVTWCGDGAEALWRAGRTDATVVILSATLPVVPAAEVATVIAGHRQTPGAIAVAVGHGEADMAGPVLAAGANRVVSRPYRARELESLVATWPSGAEQGQWEAVLRVGRLELDAPAFEASMDGRPLRLTLREFELLRLLMLRPGDVVLHEYVRDQLSGAHGKAVSANTIAVHVRRLRSHLAGAADILTVRGLGYRLVVRQAAAPAASERTLVHDVAPPKRCQPSQISACGPPMLGRTTCMSERDDRPADEASREGPREQLARDVAEGGDPGAVGAVDGAAAAGSIGAVGGGKRDSLMPQEAPDPSIGPD